MIGNEPGATSMQQGVAVPTNHVAICATSLPSGTPTCHYYQSQCCKKTLVKKVSTALTMYAGFNALNILAGAPAGKGMGRGANCTAAAVAIGANFQTNAAALDACDDDPDACPPESLNQLKAGTEALCSALGCLPPGPQIAAIQAACSAGKMFASLLTCAVNKPLCIREIENSNPILPGTCPDRYISVSACDPDGAPLPLTNILAACQDLTLSRYTGTTAGACGAVCRANTEVQMGLCRMVVPPPASGPADCITGYSPSPNFHVPCCAGLNWEEMPGTNGKAGTCM